MRIRTLLIIAAFLGLMAAGWNYVAHDELGDVTVPEVPDGPLPEDPPSDGPSSEDPPAPTRRDVLAEVRRECRLGSLDAFIEAQRALVEQAETPADRGRHLHVLAEAYLERVYCRTARLGMRPGEPLFRRVPAPIEADIRAGLEALAEARAVGEPEADGYRVEGSLLANRITSMGTAMKLKRPITDAYKRSLELDAENPRLHVALGCRKLFAPKLLGRNLDKAMEHLTYAARGLPQDERPRIFAALVAYMQDDEGEALRWAQEALQVNNRNIFVIAVLERLLAGEADPFGRDA
ncbi:MAG: hypothetical protein QNJ98_04765 [Planctomycetota bacterium]|nr:hypothetical protein [Planctomycetota bacterium]